MLGSVCDPKIEACFFAESTTHDDTPPESCLFTCGIRPQHRNKSFLQVYKEDPQFVQWVLSLTYDEILSENLKRFSSFCRTEAEWKART